MLLLSITGLVLQVRIFPANRQSPHYFAHRKDEREIIQAFITQQSLFSLTYTMTFTHSFLYVSSHVPKFATFSSGGEVKSVSKIGWMIGKTTVYILLKVSSDVTNRKRCGGQLATLYPSTLAERISPIYSEM